MDARCSTGVAPTFNEVTMVETTMRIAGTSDKAIARRFNFTIRALAAVTAPPSGRCWVYDSGCPHLALMVTPTARSFYWCGRVRGRRSPIRYKLADESIGIENARKMAKELTGNVAKGHDPMAARHQIRGETTLGELFTLFIEHHAKSKKRSWQKDEERFKNHLKLLKHRPISSITRDDVEALHTRIGTKHPALANRVVALLSAVYNNRAKSLTNPCRGLSRFPEHPRRRTLSPDELDRFRAALADTAQPWRDLFSLAFFSGQRIGNLRSMRWDELVVDDGIWRIPAQKFKGKHDHELNLSPEAVAIIETRKGNGSEWVFPARSATGYIAEPAIAWRDLCERAELKGFWIHDIRALYATTMAALNVGTDQIQKHLGHEDIKTTTGYVRLAGKQVRASVIKTSAFLAGTPTAAKNGGEK